MLIHYLLFYTSNNSNFVLELDFEPFNASFPRPSMSKSIGNGVQFLNRHLSSKLFQDKESLYPLLNFLKAHNYKGTVSFQKSGICQTHTSEWMTSLTLLLPRNLMLPENVIK